MNIKLHSILKNLLRENVESEEVFEELLFTWKIPVGKNLTEDSYAFVAPSQERAKVKADLEQALNQVKTEYNKIMSMFYYFDDKSLGTISEKVLSALLEKTGVFKSNSVSQVGGSGGLSDIDIAGQGVSLKTTQLDKVIGVGSAGKEGGIKVGDQTAPNKLLGKKLTPGTKYKISGIKNKEAKEAIIRKVYSVSMKLGNDLFLWASISRNKDKRLNGFTFYLLDIDGKRLYTDILKTGSFSLQKGKSGGVGESFNIYDKNGVLFSAGDTGSKYLNVSPEWVLSQFNPVKAKLSGMKEAKSIVVDKDAEQGAVQGSKITIKVDPAANKPSKFSFDEVSKQVFNAMLDVLTDPKNVQKIVSAIPVG